MAPLIETFFSDCTARAKGVFSKKSSYIGGGGQCGRPEVLGRARVDLVGRSVGRPDPGLVGRPEGPTPSAGGMHFGFVVSPYFIRTWPLLRLLRLFFHTLLDFRISKKVQQCSTWAHVAISPATIMTCKKDPRDLWRSEPQQAAESVERKQALGRFPWPILP